MIDTDEKTPIDVTPWLNALNERGGSDLFVTADAPPLLKVNGRLYPLTKYALTPAQSQDAVMSVMNDRQRASFEETHECNFALGMGDKTRFRISAFYQRHHVGMVCRLVQTRIPTFEEMDLPADSLGKLALAKRGIILLVGGTGSGKSTTLAAMLGHRNRNQSGHIVTIEDPIEFVHRHAKSLITQREVGNDTESFEVGLRNTLRQAPDVIMIGEIRTREAMEHALTFAETGHLVLATLHANNANQTMDRILHFFPEEQREQVLLDLSFNLRATIAQQLLSAIDRERRHVALEILINTPLVQEKIRKGEIQDVKPIMKDSQQHGMMTFDQSLVRMYEDGKISYDDAIRHADSANEVRLAVKLASGGDAKSLANQLEASGLQGFE